MKLTLAARLFSDKYQQEMSMDSYLNYLERGFELLRENALEHHNELKELKAIRMALEFRVAFMSIRLKARNEKYSSHAAVAM